MDCPWSQVAVCWFVWGSRTRAGAELKRILFLFVTKICPSAGRKTVCVLPVTTGSSGVAWWGLVQSSVCWEKQRFHVEVVGFVFLCLYYFLSFLLPCVCVCVWQGAWLLLSCSRSDTPVINSFQSPLSFKAWSQLHSSAGLMLLHACVWCSPTRLFMLFVSRIYLSANTLPFQPVFCLHNSPCRSSRYSASTTHPAVPAGIQPLLITLPFQPVSASTAHPAISSRNPPRLI